MDSSSITIIGAPFNGIGVSPEHENPARSLREAGLIDRLRSSGVTVADSGDIEIAPFDGERDERSHVLNLESWKQSSLNLTHALSDALEMHAMPLVLGGDCGILLGIMGAFVERRERVGLVMLDGHTDFRDPASSPTGEAADFPLWVLSGRGPRELSQLYGEAPILRDREIVIVGYREPDMIDQSHIQRYDYTRVSERGIESVIRESMSALPDNCLSLWVHFDVDVINPLEMPAVHFPEQGGLSLIECRVALDTLLTSGRAIGLSVACYHSDVDPDLTSAGKLVRMLSAVLT